MILLRAGAWLAAGALLLGLGLLGLGAGLVALELARRGGDLGAVQGAGLRALYTAILLRGLLPQLVATAAVWLALVRLVPSLDRSWTRLLLFLPLVSAALFPLTALTTFTLWSPTSVMDVVGTVAWIAGGSAAALLIPRRWIRALAPGRLAPMGAA